MLKEVRQAAVTVVAVALFGALLGVLWWKLAPSVPLVGDVVGDSWVVYLKDSEGEQAIGVDGTFTLLALAFGAVSAVVVFLLRRRGECRWWRRSASAGCSGRCWRGGSGCGSGGPGRDRAREGRGQGGHVLRAAEAGGEGGAAGVVLRGARGASGVDGAVRPPGPGARSPGRGPGSMRRGRTGAGASRAASGSPGVGARPGVAGCLPPLSASLGREAGRGQGRAIGARVAWVRSARSVGESSTSRPRRPAETQIVGWAEAEASSTVARRLRWPSGEMPPRT